jgi:hypothetical protein
VYGGPLGLARVATVEENHGGNDRLVRVRVRRRPSPFARVLAATLAVAAAVAVPAAPLITGSVAAAAVALLAARTVRDARRAGRVAGLIADTAAGMGMTPVRDARRPEPTHQD